MRMREVKVTPQGWSWGKYSLLSAFLIFTFLSTCVYFPEMNTKYGRVSDDVILCLISIRVCLLNEPC